MDPLLGFKPSHFGSDSDYHYDAMDAVSQYINDRRASRNRDPRCYLTRWKEVWMFLGEHSDVMGEVGGVVILWGIPTLLAFTAWWRYRQIQINYRPSLLRIAMLSLLVSEAMLLLIGAAVALESISTARLRFMPQTVGFINFLLCAVALLASLTAKTSDTARIWITAASAYLMFLWLYAMMAH